MGSYPALASIEAGKRIAKEVAADLANQYREFMTED